ncbi:hypothetical protein ACFWGD_08270 [Corynebacterium sp. NPDC060344]|uniref:hypothetical protein n=1 Tax=Corynebacterium sp. NPDC060344 TaxID=3347101 RepID=UPI00366509BA
MPNHDDIVAQLTFGFWPLLLAINTTKRMQDIGTVLSAIDPDYPGWAFRDSRVRTVAARDPRRGR